MKHSALHVLLSIGILVSVPTTVSAQNHALEFDGSNDQVSVADHSSLDLTTNATWSCWVKTDSTVNQCLFSKFTTFDEDGYYINYYENAFYFSQGTPGGTLIQTGSTANSLAAGLWQHLAIVKNDSTVTIYRNGVDITSSHGTHVDIVAGSSPMILGRTSNGLQTIDGLMDEVRVWNTALDQAAIQAWMYRELTTAHPNYSDSTGDNLKAWYRMSDGTGTSLTDNSANSNTGTLQNGMGSANWATSAAFAGPKNCLDFDGTDDFVNCGNHSSLGITGTALTVESWIYPTSFRSNRWECTAIGMDGPAQTGYVLRFGGAGQLSFVIGNTTTWTEVYSPTGTLSLNSWQHVAGVYNGNTLKVYRDGVEVGSTNFSGSITASGSVNCYIGESSLFNRRLIGRIDEVRIWNVARTDQQIRENMCKTLTGNEISLAAWYTFDNSAGNTLQDLSSNSNDGTLTSMDPATDWVASAAFNTWLDTGSTAWSTATNWSRGSVPGASDNVGIVDHSGGSDPETSGSTSVNILALGSSSTLALGSALGVTGTLVMAGGDVINGSNTLTVGSSETSLGRVAWSAGSVVGQLARWLTYAAVDDVIFPAGTAGTDLPVTLSYPTAPPEGGTITVSFTASAPGTSGIPANDASDSNYTVDRISEEGFWTVTGGVGFFGTDFDLDLAASGFDNVSDYTELHALYRENAGVDWQFRGSHAAGTGSNGFPVAHRTGITYAFGDFAVGSSSADNPLLIELVSFTAEACTAGDCIRLAWETASELATAGFHLWRGERVEGRMTSIVRLTGQLIPSEGGASWGASYEFHDDQATPGRRYFYALEDIDDFGLNTFHGPVSAAIGRERIELLAPADGAFVPLVPAPLFQWDGAGLFRYKLAFSTTPDLNGDVLVLPIGDSDNGGWIFGQSYIPSPRELRSLARLGSAGRTVYWSVYGQAEPGDGVFAPPRGMTMTAWGGEH